MKIPALAVAAAVALGLVGTTPAAAQPRHDRVVVTKTRTVTVHRDERRGREWNRGDRRHYGWERGRHRGWHKKVRVCRSIWRRHHRERICTWRYR